VGWQDRDWAKLNDAELEALYGVTRRPPASSSGATLPPTTRSYRVPHVRTTTTGRQRFWIGMAFFLVSAGGFAYTHRETAPVSSLTAQPTVLFGIRGTNTSVPAGTPGGADTVCTEEAFNASANQWSCLVWALNPSGLQVVQPTPYRGPCTHLAAATTVARWNCLGNETFAPGELPSAADSSS
jgi:hypothetical protein